MAIGAYAVERDYSQYVAHATQTIFAVVGTATKGPINEAVICTSVQDLVNKFGPLCTNCYALYAAQYFLSQSSKLYFVRAAHTSNIKDGQSDMTEIAAASTAEIPGINASGTAITDAITLAIRELGTHGDSYSIIVSKGTSEGAYNLTLKKSGATVESIKDIKLEDLKVDYTTEYFKVSAVNSAAAELTTSTGEGASAIDYIEVKFSGGNDGIKDIDAGDYINAANTLLPNTVDMNLFAVPGVSDASVVTAMLSIAETRGDCLYLVDPPKGLTREGVVNWHNGEGDYGHSAFNSSYGALYFDWVNIYDPVNKVTLAVPPSVLAAATYAYSDRTSELWFAPAGLNRGLVRGALSSVTKLSKNDVDLLYSGDNSINSIYEDPQVGLVLWGQKTLLRAETALNRVNVRRLMNYLKRVVVAASNYLVFEPNDRVTWNRFEMKVKPVLENIKAHRGIYEYRIVKGEVVVTESDIDNYRMPCMIMVRPTKAAEEIPIYFVITSAGAEFNEVLEANGIITDL